MAILLFKEVSQQTFELSNEMTYFMTTIKSLTGSVILRTKNMDKGNSLVYCVIKWNRPQVYE